MVLHHQSKDLSRFVTALFQLVDELLLDDPRSQPGWFGTYLGLVFKVRYSPLWNGFQNPINSLRL